MFERVLIANRGEIVVRITRTLHRMGIAAVAVHSDADTDAPHVRGADVAVRIGTAAATDSYLRIDRIVEAALATGAQAVHPGYGFLAENDAFAAACAEAGLVFIGPPVAAIAAMGDKIRAKALVAAAGVAVVPGSDGRGPDDRGLDDDALADAARTIGFPVLLKPSAGGGGKGMRLVEDPEDLGHQIAGARREASGAFGDDTLLLERFVEAPRHIEIQVLADRHGGVVHLGERECSLQRRHQKIVEEAPSPLLDDTTRTAMGEAAIAAALACGYTGAGTVEFIVPSAHPEQFFFMEMNTRLQVEHPVTEAIHGLDLVEWQLRVAAGEALPFTTDQLVAHGHAIEARVYAEDPARGFLPTGGTVLALHEPIGHDGVRVDAAWAPGLHVGSDYDPMLAKVVAHGHDRAEARRRLDRALAATSVLGVTTNIGFLRALLADDDVRAGRLDTGLVERRLDTLLADDLLADDLPSAVALGSALLWLTDGPPVTDPWASPTGWTTSGHREVAATLDVAGRASATVTLRHRESGWWGAVDSGTEHPVALAPGGADEVVVVVDGRHHRLHTVVAPDGTRWLGAGGRTWAVRVEEPWEAHAGDRTVGHRGPVLAPMPGTLTTVLVSAGDEVTAGQPLAVVEAMKMEFTLRAPFDGVVAEVHASAGSAVALSAPVVTVEAPTDGAANDEPDVPER